MRATCSASLSRFTRCSPATVRALKARSSVHASQQMAPASTTHDGVVALVQKQFELYNARDLEGFMTLFSDDITVTDMVTDEVMASNKAEVRARYEKRFSTPVRAELLGRLVLGPVVHDREVIYGLPDNGVAECLATYVIDTSSAPFLIKKMKFVWMPRS